MYGNWLPGDNRGFVSNVRVDDGPEIRHNIPGTEYDANMPCLEAYARGKLSGEPVRISVEQAEALLEQFHETVDYRGRRLLAVGIMANHCHVVIGVPRDPEPAQMLQSLKSYGSRKLNRHWTRPTGGTWWTESGSKRKLPDDAAVLGAVQYVVDQDYPLLIWTAEVPELNLNGGRIV